MPPIIIDDFESGLRESNPSSAVPLKYLWYHEDYWTNEYGSGSEGVTTDEHHSGAKALYGYKIDNPGTMQYWWNNKYANAVSMSLNPHDDIAEEWDYMRQWVLIPADWIADTFNRLTFWIKVPPTTYRNTYAVDGVDYNMHFGTYNRRWGQVDKSSAEDEPSETYNSHFYHWYNIEYTGEWHQIQVETYPDHQRYADSNTDGGDKIYYEYDIFGESEAGHNYFDCLTRFYIHWMQNPTSFPCYWYFDDFVCWEDIYANLQNLEEARNLHGVYVPSSNKIIFGFKKQKSTTASYNVRYAWASMYVNGWDSGIDAPDGTISSATGAGGFNEMYYSTTSIDVANHPYVYMAVKKSGSSYFREIEIPTGIPAGIPKLTGVKIVGGSMR